MEKGYTVEIEGMKLSIEVDKGQAPDQREEMMTAYEMKAIREKTGMNRKEFAEWLGIPYRTISDWEHGERKMPEYVMRLMAYKVRMEFVEKRGD
ncbi:helix-turn-helix domain-containing protein [Butyrivibrio sp. AC2005]|uniref:helix-turn-helix domain-containing protein n=1 Tax=Butyrivibrio sp. AC2005 TaxID=1280672 RepID=UPI0004104891|nr:helix-turn-helix domain-containing protein [Butyrivibrio sp. AC2005]